MISPEQLIELAQMSARIGRNDLLVQGPGGNTSIKDAEELWVKASGVWLAEALDKPLFVPLAMSQLRDREGAVLLEAPQSAVIAARTPSGLRPSIETALHALMPHPVVIHAHAVNAMTFSVLADGEDRARARLTGLRWSWVGYRRPGAPLAQAVAEAIAANPIDVLILQNHGVVVGGSSVAEAEALLLEVEGCLALNAREFERPPPASKDPRIDGPFEPHPRASRLAMDPATATLLTTVPLVPDQVVFLGGAVPVLEATESISEASARVQFATGVVPMLFISPGVGAYADRNRTAAAESLILGLVEIASRLPRDAQVVGLTSNDVVALSNWDAEHYRLALNASQSGTH